MCGTPFGSFGDSAAGMGGAGSPVDICGACRQRKPVFTYARSAGRYDGALREALHAFKFSGKTTLAVPLAELIAEQCAGALPAPVDLVVAVPLHRARERERGFNQSALLAARLARALDAPFQGRALRRVRATLAQADLTGRERRDNVRGAFAADRDAVTGRHVLLVDDVLTTGATVSECARVLMAAGAASVGIVTVARVV